MPDLTHAQWALLALGAFFAGLSKTGIAGLGILSVTLFANALPARESTGTLLPMLICADVFGVAIYRRHAHWGHLWKLCPWVVCGIVAGYAAMGRVTDSQVRFAMGTLVLGLMVLHLWQQRQAALNPGGFGALLPHSAWFRATMGILAGFTTMVANAAGPIMAMYLLAMALPKMAFLGTTAWFFMLVNLFKVPFSLDLGLINAGSLAIDAALLPALVPGALLGPVIVKRINQKWFERMVLTLTVTAALRLLLS
ncbi:MAG: sulfite exporter TauE/SafE family protein [Lentisphaerae bacterium]|nr:sulfite exporter TauE/SafE family protein [Lentisphaerota bacterium]